MWKKITSIFLWIYLVCSFISAMALSKDLAVSLDTPVIIAFIVCFLGFLMPMLGIGLLYEIAVDVEEIKNKEQASISKPVNEHSSYSTQKTSEGNSRLLSSETSKKGYWTCRKCNCENSSSSMYCEKCGSRK